MSTTLRELLELPDPDLPSEATQFGQDFRQGMSGINTDLRQVASQGDRGTHQRLDSQRQTLISAYQSVFAGGDETSQQRVIAAVAKVRGNTSSEKSKVELGRSEWDKCEPDFDAALVKIAELEAAEHPKAAVYRKLSEGILNHANRRDYGQACGVFAQLQPKLDQAYVLHMGSAGSDAPSGPGNAQSSSGGNASTGGNPPTASGSGATPPQNSSARQALPTADMRQGSILANRDVERHHNNPKSLWDQDVLKKNPQLQKTLDDFVAGKQGQSVRNLNLEGKTADQMRQELLDKGFEHHPERLASGVPHDIYTHRDGGMVRIKPEGDPASPHRSQPHVSKSVLYDPDKGTGYENEAFKVANEGQAVPKSPSSGAGMNENPRSVEVVKSGGTTSKITSANRGPDGQILEEDAFEIKKDQKRTTTVAGQHPVSPKTRDQAKGYADTEASQAHTNLPPTNQGSPPNPPGPARAGSPEPATTTSPKAAEAPTLPQSASSNDDHARSEATKLRGAIEAQGKQSAEQLLRMQKLEPVLKAKVDAATGDEKQALAEKQARLAKEIKAAEGVVTRADADLKAIDNPGTKREELLAILARQKAGGKVAESTEITAAGLDPDKKGKVNRDVTATTTSYADGRATTESVRSQQKVGLDGLTKTQTHSKEVTDGRSTATSTSEKKVNLSLDGKRTVTEKKSIEVQHADGGKASLEVENESEISSKGFSETKTATATKTDGSSVSKTTSTGVERGDGAVVGKATSSVTKTDESGRAISTTGSASGGFTAGDGAMGAKGSVGGGKSVTSKKGRQAAANARLHANVSCKIGDPKGTPPLYPVTVTVSFGASGAVSAGAGQKKGSKASAGVEVTGSLEGRMVVTHHLGEAALADYVAALEAASKGDKSAATQQEIEIIAAGVNDGWEVARQMWDAINHSVSKKTVDGLTHSGDSAAVSQTKSGGGTVKGNVGPVGARYGKTYTQSSSTEVKRNDAGGLDVAAKHEQGEQTDLSGSLNVGAFGATVGTTDVHKRRFGYAIQIPRENDPDGTILTALDKCASELDYEVFIAANFMKIKVLSRSKGSTDAEGTNFGISAFGKSANFGTHQGTDKGIVTDATGKVINQTTVGTEGAGGALGGLADSQEDVATAETDAEGNSTLSLSSTEKKNYGSRVREKEKEKAMEKLTGTGKATGALTDAAGGDEDDNAVQDVKTLKLSNKELRRLGATKQKDTWMGMTRRWQEKEDWLKAFVAIRKANGAPSAVAHALAEFIGNDRVERLETVRQIFRGGHRRMGKASEFPDSLRDIRADYDLVTSDGVLKKLNDISKKDGAAAASQEGEKLLAIVDRLLARVQACKDFDSNATKTEMLSELNLRRTVLNQGNLVGRGVVKPEDDPKVLADEGTRLMKLCYAYGVEQERLVAKLEDQDAITSTEKREGRALIRQLEDLHYRWQSEVFRLQENYQKQKLPMPQTPPFNRYTPQLRPHYPLVETYEKKFGKS
jgi:hypothetical protein